MKIIKHAKQIKAIRYYRSLSRGNGSGFAFECNVDGTLIKRTEEHVQETLAQDARLSDEGVISESWFYKEPAIGLCACGNHVELRSTWTNECDRCERLYNGSGQELAPREQWGEETGEHPVDVFYLRGTD